MDTQADNLDGSSIPSEAGAPAVAPVPVRNLVAPTTWQFDKLTDEYFHPVTGARVPKAELTAWEKLQRTPDGRDALRGVKLKDRLDGVLGSRLIAAADATGTP